MDITKKAIFVSGLILLTVFICGHAAIGADDGPVTIGILENQSFAYADMMKKSFALALESINFQGGINGRNLKLAYANDGGKKRMGLEALRHLIRSEKPVMLTGGYSSSNTLALTQKADDLNIPFLVSTAADDRITQHKRKNIFRLAPPISEYAKGLEGLLVQQLKPKSMAIVYENSPFGTRGATQMMWFCRDNKIQIKAIIPYHKERAASNYFDRLITPLKRNPPEAIYMISYKKDGVLMVQRIRAAGIHSHLMGGAGGFTHPAFIAETGEDSKYMMTATLWAAELQNPLTSQYVNRYRSKHNETPDYHGAEAYSALLVAADALRRAKSMNAEDIRDALNRTQIETPFGPVAFTSYDQFERQNRQDTLVLQVLNGRYECVWPRDVSVAELILPAPVGGDYRGMKESSR